MVLAVIIVSRMHHKETDVKLPRFMKKILRIKDEDTENTAVHPKKIAKSLDKLFLIAFSIAVVLNIVFYFIFCAVSGATLKYFSF